jgi:hypothetical protein
MECDPVLSLNVLEIDLHRSILYIDYWVLSHHRSLDASDG